MTIQCARGGCRAAATCRLGGRLWAAGAAPRPDNCIRFATGAILCDAHFNAVAADPARFFGDHFADDMLAAAVRAGAAAPDWESVKADRLALAGYVNGF